MNLTIDERVKHRIVGVVVLMALGAIVAPLLMKQSIARFQDKQLVMITVPPKPIKPVVIVPDERALFKRMKVATVHLPTIEKPAMSVALADATSLAQPKRPLAEEKGQKVAEKPNLLGANTKGNISGNKSFAVQLAAFLKEESAASLVNQLKTHGYRAFYVQRSNKGGNVYSVRVGTYATSQEASDIQATLAKKMRLNGYVFITQGVG